MIELVELVVSRAATEPNSARLSELKIVELAPTKSNSLRHASWSRTHATLHRSLTAKVLLPLIRSKARFSRFCARYATRLSDSAHLE